MFLASMVSSSAIFDLIFAVRPASAAARCTLIRALGNRLTDLCAGVSRAVDVDLSVSGARGAFSRVRRSAIGKPVAEEERRHGSHNDEH